jgi:hypothetical protein
MRKTFILQLFDYFKVFLQQLRSETTDLRHKTQLMAKWGSNSHFEARVDAGIEKTSVSKSGEVSLVLKSSFDRLENFKIIAK